jgi:hypothetical protein
MTITHLGIDFRKLFHIVAQDEPRRIQVKRRITKV